MSDKCNCHHWICGCDFTVGHKPDCQSPCDKCGVLIDTDIYKEELGMCLECSNEYWSHSGT